MPKKQARLSYFMKRSVQETEQNVDERAPSSDSESDIDDDTVDKQESQVSKKRKHDRIWQDSWCNKWPWLKLEYGKIFCEICRACKKTNALTEGSVNFRTSTFKRHLASKDHQNALIEKESAKSMDRALAQVFSENENAILYAMRTVYFMAKMDIPSNKYSDLIDFLEFQGCEPIKLTCRSNNCTYRSHEIVTDMQHAMAQVIIQQTDEKLANADFISFLVDESTDIAINKKLCLYARIVSQCQPEVIFLGNIDIADGKADTITGIIVKYCEDKGISMRKVVGLGSDGAAVMTGRKNGVAAQLKKLNPFMKNVHCIAHRLALVTSQAADGVQYLNKYKETLTSIFYWFKHSACRTNALHEMEKVLGMPQLKFKEIHQVRWFAFYNALQTMHRCWLPLVMQLEQDKVKDATGKGILKIITQFEFIATTNMLMDVIPLVTELNLVFQKKDLDIAVVAPAINRVKRDLGKLLETDGLFLQEFMQDVGATKCKYYKDISITDTPQQRQGFKKCKQTFISNIIQKMDDRFPESITEVTSLFPVLGLRGLRFADTESFGNVQIEALAAMYGTDIDMHEAYINKMESVREWDLLKDTVVQQQYPTVSTSELFQIIHTHHKDSFPNLIKLASIGMCLPVHTADVERGFSAQNIVKTKLRNKLSGQNLNNLLIIKIQGADYKHFQYPKSLKIFRDAKQRRVLP